MNKKFLIFSIVLLAVLSGVLIFLKVKYQNNTTNHPLIGGQKDEHGCLIPAGYSWCEARQKCLRTWEEPCETTPSSPRD